MPEPLISNVSDTARWVAAYRAKETARPDALFHDPLAERLAGEKGHAIAAQAPGAMRRGWPIVTRTKLIDDLVMKSVAEGADTVLNLAAGLDTRPYRLDLPPSLHWIEADLPRLLEAKEELLAGEKPACKLTRIKVDLSKPEARAAFLNEALASSKNALVITEGLLIYLDQETVRSLAQALAWRPGIRWWIMDLCSPKILQMMQRGFGKGLDNAPMKFAPPDGVAFFENLGWKAKDIFSLLRAAIRFRRVSPFLRLIAPLVPEADPRNPKGRWGAIVRFEK